MLLQGIFLPLTTPFRSDGRLFLSKLEDNVDHYSRTPASGMLVLGSAGEADALTEEETRLVFARAIDAASSGKVMIAGIGRASVHTTLLLADAAAAAGYDAIAVGTTEALRNVGMRLEQMTYFRMIADRSALPIVLVSESGRQIELDAVVELAGHPQIIGVMDETGGGARLAELIARTAAIRREVIVSTVFAAVTGRMLAQARQRDEAAVRGSFVSIESLSGGVHVAASAAPVSSLKTRSKQVGFQVLSASSAGMHEAWQAGAAGAIPRLAACAPQACCEVYQAFKDGDDGLASEKQTRLQPASECMAGPGGIAALKYGCDLNGYFGGRPRLPLLPLTAEVRERVEGALAELRN